MRVYCIFCKSGSERDIQKHIDVVHNGDVKVMVPIRIMQERRKGVWKECEKLLLPGYVFVYIEDNEKYFGDDLKVEKKTEGFSLTNNFKNYFKIDGSRFLKNVKKQKLKFDYIKTLLDVCKFLDYEAGAKELVGNDFYYADWIYRYKGRIGQSLILEEGEHIKVLEGPLKDCEGKIVKLDRRKKRAWVEFDFDGEKRKISLMVDNVIE